ncbi:MAG: LPS export ABC transporter periplasmic protein LptC [Proteobacteria bacterium]|nr:LPS export ABC transporter periplasmic protein LptC [Pseudomonadota bacterium]MBU4296082.1 LPS export ABC transporter periplasmic protein LptC [Pseudomonadota bacterium]MCG2748018.1 LPS export ABC transporter periplasmic protein LptC [Desulfobulbaceae bacterium]
MMLSGSRNLLWIVPLALLLTSPAWKPGLEEFLSPLGNLKVKPGNSVPDKSFTLTDVQLSRYENGQVDLVLNAAKVRSGRRGMDSLLLSKVDALLFDKGRERAHITGGEGFYDADKRILTLVEDVVVIAKNRYELRADTLRYLIPYKTIKTAAQIFFKSKDITVRGTGMSYNLDSGAYRVGGRVVCDVK